MTKLVNMWLMNYNCINDNSIKGKLIPEFKPFL